MDLRAPTSPVGRVLAAGVAVLVATLVFLRSPPAAWERGLARVAYDLPSALTGVLEVVMQAGTRAAILVIAVGLLVLRRGRAAVVVLLAGSLAWGAAVVAKELVDRPRPTSAVLGRSIREVVDGSGFPSSHAAIAAALATALVLAARLRPALAVAVVAVAALTALARVHLGVHWPLDVVGGAAIGVVGGALGAGVVQRWAPR